MSHIVGATRRSGLGSPDAGRPGYLCDLDAIRVEFTRSNGVMIVQHWSLIRMSRPLPALEGAAFSLRERWHAESLAAVWLRPGDWYHPAVDALVEALAEGRDPVGAAERLGSARGSGGIGIGEAVDDLLCAFTVSGEDPEPSVLRALAVGWAAGNEELTPPGDLVDPWTGLPTLDYLVLRLKETYGAAARAGLDPRATHALVVIDVSLEEIDKFQRLARAATMGRALADVFGDGHPVVVATPGTYVALCERDEDLGTFAVRVRSAVERWGNAGGVSAILRRPPHVWVEPLPATPEQVLALLGPRD